MPIIEQVRALLNDIENDRVERTISSTNTDKFGQAICAFANDLLNYDFSYQTAVSVCENKSPRGERMTQEAINNGFIMKTMQSETLITSLQKRSQKGLV